MQAIRQEGNTRRVYKIKQEMCTNRKQMNTMTKAEGPGTDHDTNAQTRVQFRLRRGKREPGFSYMYL